MKYAWTVSLVGGALVGGLLGCGGGSAGGSAAKPATGLTGYSVPTEISPVAAVQNGQPAHAFQALLARALPLTAAAGLDAGTDYSDALTSRYVTEHAIDQFSIIETILNATAQTHYADADNINHGPYKSIVSWHESNQGSSSVTIQTWVVDSRMAGGVNEVDAWIEDSGQLIRARFLITQSATQRSDGSYADYGKWTLNVKFDDSGTTFFEAKADIVGAETVLTINNHEVHGAQAYDRKGVVHKGDSVGYGKVTYTQDNGAGAAEVTATYAYDGAQLLVQEGAGTPVYKDRTATVDMVQNYGMFRSDTGENVLKTHSFGFPVSFGLGQGALQGYYGAYQGRHSLWLQGGTGTIPDGTVVTRQDQGNSATTYKTISYTGTLTRRTLVAADLSDILNLPVEIWANMQFPLQLSNGVWQKDGAPFTDFGGLAPAPRKFVNIFGWDNVHQQPVNAIYDPIGMNGHGAGFYNANMNPGNGVMTSQGTLIDPSVTQLFVNIGGSIYIQYTGSDAAPAYGWVQKKVVSFDQMTYTPSFDPNGDKPYTLTPGMQYYINKQGGNYVVTCSAPGAFDVQMEIQTAGNPLNLDPQSPRFLLGGIASFRPQMYSAGSPNQTSTYSFGTDPAVPATYMHLVYKTIGTQDGNATPPPTVGALVATGQWGLAALDAQGAPVLDQASRPVQFNWDYPQAQNGGNQGVQTFLYNDGANGRDYKLLDDPIALMPLDLTTLSGASKTCSLQFDGWMQGLPRFDDELARNNWNITDDVAAKVINIPAATVATDSLDHTLTYLIKPLQVGVYLKLAAVPDPTLNLDLANTLDLAAPGVLPAYSDNGMSATVPPATLKYSSGDPVN